MTSPRPHGPALRVRRLCPALRGVPARGLCPAGVPPIFGALAHAHTLLTRVGPERTCTRTHAICFLAFLCPQLQCLQMLMFSSLKVRESKGTPPHTHTHQLTNRAPFSSPCVSGQCLSVPDSAPHLPCPYLSTAGACAPEMEVLVRAEQLLSGGGREEPATMNPALIPPSQHALVSRGHATECHRRRGLKQHGSVVGRRPARPVVHAKPRKAKPQVSAAWMPLWRLWAESTSESTQAGCWHRWGHDTPISLAGCQLVAVLLPLQAAHSFNQLPGRAHRTTCVSEGPCT